MRTSKTNFDNDMHEEQTAQFILVTKDDWSAEALMIPIMRNILQIQKQCKYIKTVNFLYFFLQKDQQGLKDGALQMISFSQ